MATYIVGDIQACLSGLQRLLKKVNFCLKTDKLIAVGDLIGRGPQALDTLEYLMGLGNSFDTVLGNHDLHFLAIYAGVRKAKASDKFDDLLASPKIETYIDWLRQKPLALTLDKQTLICHAGLYPQWSIKQGVKYSKEISQILGSAQWKIFLANMYGSQPNIWHDKLKGAERNRFIVNAFTRMRFLEQKSALNFDCKSTPEDAPKKLEPWFNITNSQLTKHQSIIFGHWAALQGKTRLKNIIGLDTGYLWGLSMTLLDFDTKIKYSVENKEK